MINPISKAHNVVVDGIALVRARAAEFFTNPTADFSRESGPFTLENTVFASICQGKQNMDSDAAQRFFEAENPARFGSSSAFIQAKQKIRPEAFKFLSDHFADTISAELPSARYKNRILLGVDGSKVNITLDSRNEDCYFPPRKEGGKGYCQVHLNGMTDLLTGLIVDFDIQPGRYSSERAALKSMAARYAGRNDVVVVADRGYESFSVVCSLIQNQIPFVIRGRDIHSNGIARSIPDLPEDPFDLDWDITLTERHTKETLGNPHKYKVLSIAQCEDIPLPYQLHLRVVRIEIGEGQYEVLLTNLPRDEFDPESLKEIYHLRWGIEVTYLKLKYRVGLNSFQSRNPDLIMIEIASRILFYNICTAISCMIEPDTGGRNPDGYKLDFSAVTTWIRAWYRNGRVRADDLVHRLAKCVISIRQGRKYARNLRPKSFRWFAYR